MAGIFITSSGTEIGKTFISCALLQALKARGQACHALKPVISGMQDVALTETDSGRLLQALGKEPSKASINAISPWQFLAPLTPSAAARAEGKTVPFHDVVEFCKEEIEAHAPNVTFIEAAGGIMAPLTETHTMRDWLLALNIPALLVVGNYLGTLSHTLTALESMRALQRPIAVAVSDQGAGGVRLEDTVAALKKFVPADISIFPVAYQPDSQQVNVEELADWVEGLCNPQK